MTRVSKARPYLLGRAEMNMLVMKSLTAMSLMSLSATVLLGLIGAIVMYTGSRQILAGTLTLGGFVTFTAFKSGGLVRIPSEIDADSIVPLGQFLARYIAREMARWEDTVGYLGDGSGTYGSVSGIGKKADTLGYKIQLASTKTKPSDISHSGLRPGRLFFSIRATCRVSCRLSSCSRDA